MPAIPNSFPRSFTINPRSCLRYCGGVFLALAWLALSGAQAQTTNYALGTASLLEGPAAGSDSVVLGVTPASAAWTNTANADWLHLSLANQSGEGSTNVIFSFDANTGATRSGTLSIAGQTLTVTQAGSTYIAANQMIALVSSNLYNPGGVAVDGAGNVYIANAGSNAIYKWTAASNTMSKLVSGQGSPAGVAVDGTGNVYFSVSSYNGAIKKWSVANSNVTTLASGLYYPESVAVDGAGNVYVADTESYAVMKWSAANSNLTTLASSLTWPEGVAVDGAGNVYIADNAIKMWSPVNSNLTTLVSSGGSTGVAVDGAGNVYSADWSGAIYKWTAASSTASTLASGFGLNEGGSLAVDATGNVYFSFYTNVGIRELTRAFVDPTARVETLAAGSDALPVVLPPSQNLLAPFAPASHQSWLTLTGITNGVVSYSFTATASNRTGDIILLGQPIPVAQGAEVLAYTLGTANLLEGPKAGNDSVVLGVSPYLYFWTNTANASWLHLSLANQSGAGSTNVIFSYDANPGATRTGTLTIAGQTLTVTQAGSTYVAASLATTLVSAGLSQPEGVAVDGSGNVYIADMNNNAIKEWTASNNTVTTLVNSGLSHPVGIAVDGLGNVYFADSSHNQIKEWTASNSNVTALVSSGLYNPIGVALDAAGNVYIADVNHNAIKEWMAANSNVTTLVSSGFTNSYGVAVDAAGNVYLDNYNSGVINELTAGNTNLTTLVNLGMYAGPNGVAVDGSGNFYFGDTWNHLVREWSAASNTVSTLISSILTSPLDVAVDGAGNVYVVDASKNTLIEVPRAFVDPTPRSESLVAGSDTLPAVLPGTADLLPPFAPTSDQSWLTITGTANGAVSFSFSTNTGFSRTAHIAMLGQAVPITQAGITYTLGTNAFFEGTNAGSDSVILTVDPNFGIWTATANAAWLHLSVANQSGSGSANVVFSFDANVGVTRLGTLTIAGQTVTVTQTSPTFTLGTNALYEGPNGGNDSVALTVNPNYGVWTATANASWLHLSLDNQSGTGGANVVFTFDDNPGATRTGSLTIAAQTVTVTQNGPAYSLGTNAIVEGTNAGSDSVALTVNPNFGDWTATANAPWLHLSADNQSGTGSTNVVFSFDADWGPTRIGALTIAGYTVTVTQMASPSLLGASARLEGAAAGMDSVVLAVTPPGSGWTNSANASWLHLNAANQTGAGSTNIIFSFDANPGSTRNGTLTIAGQTLAVTQAGSTYVAANFLATVVSSGLNLPLGIAADGAGNVYIADTDDSQIKQWPAGSYYVYTLVPYGLYWPGGVAVDHSGNVYIADTDDNAIKEWSVASHNVTTLASAGLYSPDSVAVDDSGNVYFPNNVNYSVEEWSATTSNVTTLVASGLSNPSGVAVDRAGNVYIADGNNNAIKEWSPANSNVTTLVASGLSFPSGVAVDGAGNLYFANTGDYTIKELLRAFVDPTPKLESLGAGSDALPMVLPATANLVPPFAPTSDQSWLTIDGVANGVVSFSFTANTGAARTAHITLLGQTISITQGLIGNPPTLTSAQMQMLSNGACQFWFSNTPGASFTVLSSTDMSLALSNWTVVGTASNTAPGQFQFTTPPMTNDPQRFYIIRSP